jgi:hypothetical protein
MPIKKEWIKVKRENIHFILQKELEQNPEVTSIDIAKKHKLPLFIVEVFRRRMEKANK